MLSERVRPAARGAGMADIWLSMLLSLKGLSPSSRGSGLAVGTLSLLPPPLSWGVTLRRCCPWPWASRPRSPSSMAINVRKSGWYLSLAFRSLVFSASKCLSRTTSSLRMLRSHLLIRMWDAIRDHQFDMLPLTDPVPFALSVRASDGFRLCVLSSSNRGPRFKGDSRMLGSENA